MPIVSIIVPIFKVEQEINKCIESLVNQSYENIEIILIDDGSPDNCPAICDKWAQKDKRIKVIHKPNGGLSDARNAGLDIARGDYLMFVDGDDYVDTRMVEKMLSTILKDYSDLVLCDIAKVNSKYEPIETDPKPFQAAVLDQYDFWRTYHPLRSPASWNKLYKKELFYNIRFSKGKIHEDEIILHHIISQCEKISTLEEKLYYYYQREGSIMNSNVSFRRFDYIEAWLDRCEYFKEIRAFDLERRLIIDILARSSHILCHIKLTKPQIPIYKGLRKRLLKFARQSLLKKFNLRLLIFIILYAINAKLIYSLSRKEMK